jgi:hypothetical protein
MMFPPLPKGYVPVQDYAVAAAVQPTALIEALARDGVPLMQLRIGGKVQTYVAKPRADRWLLAHLKPMEVA